jgi:hypothetical protein
MKKPLVVFPFAFLLIFLGMPEAALAKASTVKIMISGGGLTSAIEVTDPRILDISNVWGGQFLDRSRGPATEPPRGLQRYEVSFYIKITENDVRKRYVLYYCPNPAAEAGLHLLTGQRRDLVLPQCGGDSSGRARWEVELCFSRVGGFDQAHDC